MAEAKPDALSFAADALHTTALAASPGAALIEGEADYYGLSRIVLEIGRACLTPGARVVDLRCDLRAVMPLIEEHEDLCHFTLLSPNEEDRFQCFDRMRTRVRLGFVDAARIDLAERFPEVSARLFLALGALGDLPEGRRAEVARSMHRRLERDGAALIMERVGMGIGPAGQDERPPWSALEWEALFRHAGFRTVQRLWGDGERVLWQVRK